MRQQYNPENLATWLTYYADQADQTGYGMVGFKGTPYQRGAGLGSFFRSLFRMAVPVIKSAASHVGKQALSTGANIATDILQGRPVVEALEQHGKEGVSDLFQEASRALRQKGRGLGTRPKSIKAAKSDVFTKTKAKKRKSK